MDLLEGILDPNAEVGNGYENFSIQMGEDLVEGIIEGDKPDLIKVKMAFGLEIDVPRFEVTALESEGKSVMPEGLEVDMSLQDMADLISYIRSL